MQIFNVQLRLVLVLVISPASDFCQVDSRVLHLLPFHFAGVSVEIVISFVFSSLVLISILFSFLLEYWILLLRDFTQELRVDNRLVVQVDQ